MFNEGLKEMKRTGEYDKIIGTYVKDGNEAKEETADESTFVGFMQNNWKQLLHGLWMTILLTLISFVLAFNCRRYFWAIQRFTNQSITCTFNHLC